MGRRPEVPQGLETPKLTRWKSLFLVSEFVVSAFRQLSEFPIWAQYQLGALFQIARRPNYFVDRNRRANATQTNSALNVRNSSSGDLLQVSELRKE